MLNPCGLTLQPVVACAPQNESSAFLRVLKRHLNKLTRASFVRTANSLLDNLEQLEPIVWDEFLWLLLNYGCRSHNDAELITDLLNVIYLRFVHDAELAPAIERAFERQKLRLAQRGAAGSGLSALKADLPAQHSYKFLYEMVVGLYAQKVVSEPFVASMLEFLLEKRSGDESFAAILKSCVSSLTAAGHCLSHFVKIENSLQLSSTTAKMQLVNRRWHATQPESPYGSTKEITEFLTNAKFRGRSPSSPTAASTTVKFDNPVSTVTYFLTESPSSTADENS